MREKQPFQTSIIHLTPFFTVIVADVAINVLNGKPKATTFVVALNGVRLFDTTQIVNFQNRFSKQP